MPRNKSTVTIHDVAAAAGVSVSTVSRVLNNKDDVAPETYDDVCTAKDIGQGLRNVGNNPQSGGKGIRRITRSQENWIPSPRSPKVQPDLKEIGFRTTSSSIAAEVGDATAHD